MTGRTWQSTKWGLSVAALLTVLAGACGNGELDSGKQLALFHCQAACSDTAGGIVPGDKIQDYHGPDQDGAEANCVSDQANHPSSDMCSGQEPFQDSCSCSPA